MEVQEKNSENKESTRYSKAGERLRPYLLLLSPDEADRGLKDSHLLGDKEFFKLLILRLWMIEVNI